MWSVISRCTYIKSVKIEKDQDSSRLSQNAYVCSALSQPISVYACGSSSKTPTKLLK